MKTASVADLRNRFAAVSKWIQDGQTVTITKRGRPFARLMPARSSGGAPVAPAWPDRAAWRSRVYPGGPTGGDVGDVIDYDRGQT